jgi:hypothetical protein
MFPVNVPAIVPAPVMVGAEIVGLVPRTLAPEPVEVVTPVPPLATGRVPVTPVVSGSPVALVRTPDAGVPRAGVVSVGLVRVLFVSVCVPVRVTTPVSVLSAALIVLLVRV